MLDFTGGLPQSATVSFAAGETQKTVSSATVNDLLVEGAEYVYFSLTGSATASTVPVLIQNAAAFGTIYDNDFNIVVRAGSAYALEDSGELAFNITRSGELNAEVTVNYSFTTAGFVPASSGDIIGGLPQTGLSVTFAAGEFAKIVKLGIVADDVVEATEYVALNLTGATTPSSFGLDIQSSPSYGVI